MDTPGLDVSTRLLGLERRMDLVESRLGIGAPAAIPTVETTAPAPASQPVLAPPRTRGSALAGWSERQRAEGLERPAVSVRESAESLESAIGGKWYAIAGALVFVVGVGLFLKFAYDQGWLGMVPMSVRCLSAAGVGAVMLILAEWLRRRVNEWAAVGLNAAGLGTLFTAAYASYRFDLVGQMPALAMLVGVGVIGLAISCRAGLASVGVVSLLGGYVAPFLVGGDPSRAWTLPWYWLMLLAVGAGVGAWKRGAFGALRAVSVAMTMVLGGAWCARFGGRWPLDATVFIAGAWALAHAELCWSSWAGRAAREGRGLTSHMAVSVSVTAWSAVMGVMVARAGWPVADWMATAALAVATLFCGVSLAGHLRVLRDAPETEGERLGAVMLLQAGGLLIATIALAFAGWAQVSVWLALGSAAVGAGRWARSRPVRVYGVVLLSLGTARLVALDSWPGALTRSIDTFGGLVISHWGMLMLAASASWMVAAAFSAWRGPEREDSAPREVPSAWASAVLSAIGLLVLMLSVLHSQAKLESVCYAWIGLAMSAGVAGLFDRRLMLRVHALWAMALALAAWIFAFVFEGWSASGDPAGLHRGLISALVLGGGLWTLGRRAASAVPDDESRRWLGALVGVAAVGLVFAASSFEAARGAALLTSSVAVRSAAVSVWWGVFALGLLAGGYWARVSMVRLAGLALLGAAAVKAVTFDLSPHVSPGWRAASVLVLGLLMLGVGAAYARAMPRASRLTTSDAPDAV